MHAFTSSVVDGAHATYARHHGLHLRRCRCVCGESPTPRHCSTISRASAIATPILASGILAQGNAKTHTTGTRSTRRVAIGSTASRISKAGIICRNDRPTACARTCGNTRRTRSRFVSCRVIARHTSRTQRRNGNSTSIAAKVSSGRVITER